MGKTTKQLLNEKTMLKRKTERAKKTGLMLAKLAVKEVVRVKKTVDEKGKEVKSLYKVPRQLNKKNQALLARKTKQIKELNEKILYIDMQIEELAKAVA